MTATATIQSASPSPANADKPGRLEFIDAMRGIAALSVAAYHLCSWGESRSGAVGAIRHVTDWGWLGVPVFFVISGFVIAHSLRNARVTWGFSGNYALRRSLRLDPPYWTAIIASVAYEIAVRHVLKKTVVWPTTGQVFAHAVYLQNILGYENLAPGLWTLCLEVQFYLFFLAILALTQRTRLPLALLTAVLAIISMRFSLRGVIDDPAIWTNAYRFLLPNFSMFAIGIFAWLLMMNKISWWVWMAFMAIVVVRMVLGFEAEMLGAFLAGASIVFALRFLKGVAMPRFLLFLGRISYSLYLIHIIAGSFFFHLTRLLTGTATSTGIGWVLGALAFSIFVGWLMCVVVEIPSIRLAGKFRPASLR